MNENKKTIISAANDLGKAGADTNRAIPSESKKGKSTIIGGVTEIQKDGKERPGMLVVLDGGLWVCYREEGDNLEEGGNFRYKEFDFSTQKSINLDGLGVVPDDSKVDEQQVAEQLVADARRIVIERVVAMVRQSGATISKENSGFVVRVGNTKMSGLTEDEKKIIEKELESWKRANEQTR